MKFTLSWLKDYLETEATLDEITHQLTMIGLEVEEIDRGDALKAFTIAEIKEAMPHPDADRLQILKVDTGDGTLKQVVCGAPNAKKGLKGVFAKPGDYVPGAGITLSIGQIRGVESFGMMLSERELELSDAHEGIIALDDKAPIGTSYASWAQLDDPMIEINLTPNRADCTSIHGIARDLAASGMGTLKDRKVKQIIGEGACPVAINIQDQPKNAPYSAPCPAFGLRLVENVKNKPSPEWLQKRLRAIGLRPINALVDITNYITYDRGRPLHVFDADKISGNLTIGMAKEGEKFQGLDEKIYTLTDKMCVIADDQGVQSLSGVMGGLATGVDENTKNVLIESALWDADMIAATGRKLGLVSDARYRFERGVDPAFMVNGLDLATQMVLDLCGGAPSEKIIAGTVPDNEHIIEFPVSEVRRLCGLDIAPHEIKTYLKNLGFWTAGNGDVLKVAVPSWRADVEGKADLVEEIMRLVGVDKIPLVSSLGREHIAKPLLTPMQKRTRTAKRALAARGMMEAITWSFISKEEAESFGGGDGSLELDNPISQDLSFLRPSILPGLLKAAQRNSDRGYYDSALFEVGQIFFNDTPEGQKTACAAIRRGTRKLAQSGRDWAGDASEVNSFDVKADALAVLAEAGLDPEKVQIKRGSPDFYHPGRSGTLCLGPKILGHFGVFHPTLLKSLDIKGTLAGFEVILDILPNQKQKATKAKSALNVSDLMPVTRDFAFIMDREIEVQSCIKAAKGADKKLIQNVKIFDVYQGDKIDQDKKSVAIEVTFQPRDQTLQDKDLEALSAKIIQNIEKSTGGQLRG